MGVNQAAYYPSNFGASNWDLGARLLGVVGIAAAHWSGRSKWADRAVSICPRGVRPFLHFATAGHGLLALSGSERLHCGCKGSIKRDRYTRLLYSIETGHSLLFATRSVALTCALLPRMGWLEPVGEALSRPILWVQGALFAGALPTFVKSKEKIDWKEATCSALFIAFWLSDIGAFSRLR